MENYNYHMFAQLVKLMMRSKINVYHWKLSIVVIKV
nr:hypothetical protein KBIHDJOI_00049 [Spodoptera littoralis nucleopolyhedrovirus]